MIGQKHAAVFRHWAVKQFLDNVWWWGTPEFMRQLYREGKLKPRETSLLPARILGITLLSGLVIWPVSIRIAFWYITR